MTAGIGVFEALRQLGPHEVAPRDDAGLRKPHTVMAEWRSRQLQQQEPQLQQQVAVQQRVEEVRQLVGQRARA